MSATCRSLGTKGVYAWDGSKAKEDFLTPLLSLTNIDRFSVFRCDLVRYDPHNPEGEECPLRGSQQFDTLLIQHAMLSQLP